EVFGLGNLRTLFGALQAQLALTLALVQVAHRAGGQSITQRTIACAGYVGVVVRAEGIELIHGERSRRIGAQKSRDLGGPHLVHAEGIGLEGGVGGFKLCLDLIPAKALLRRSQSSREKEQRDRRRKRQGKEVFLHTQPLRRGLHGGTRKEIGSKKRKEE